ncbi:PAS domain S-box-containing protein [Paucimonas lemoignei]|uniref:histidine kinase n=1 Tax=Paucimonas lemoignei TaxID=29443 RepID=A0A4R3HSR6_PAULE|nr:response regulator [Paucimonas lemoignei]TCS35181.1 PAS domain S-box-containing protein [Paucimonas lemoignei]
MSTIRILNVDDSDAARYAKTRILQRAGFEIIEACSGGEAIAKAQSEQPDLILLDVKLPDINGFDVCKQIKQNPITEQILILQTSASFVGSLDKVRALEGGADNYLVEPVDPEELVANVKALLRLGRAESQLRESERRFRQIAENVSDVFWMFDCKDQQLLYISPAYERLWQRDKSRLAEQPLDWLEPIHPDDRIRVATAFSRFCESGMFEEEYRLVRPDGQITWIRDRGFPVRDDDPNEVRVARISQDITTSKDAEERLQQADRKKDEFLATLAHELRNPLAPIRNAVELMAIISPQASTSEQRAREVILRQTNHLVRLVDDLLDVSRITHGKVTLRQAPVELKEFVKPAIETAGPIIEARRHEFDAQLPTENVWVQGDAVRLSQVIANLLTNAAKFTPAGGHIVLSAVHSAGKLVLSVTDDGIGVDPQRMQHIFDLFAQAGHAPDRAQDGLGIGLSLVRKLVELHGGTVEVDSKGIGQGSRFTVTLPTILPAEAEPEAKKSNQDVSRSQVRNVLVVDDNVDAANTLSALIRSDGHQCTVANDGPSAIELAKKIHPDIAILDIGLPGMSGYDVANAIKTNPALRSVYLVALSGYGQVHDKQRAADAGFNQHLIKPINLDALKSLGLASAHEEK